MHSPLWGSVAQVICYNCNIRSHEHITCKQLKNDSFENKTALKKNTLAQCVCVCVVMSVKNMKIVGCRFHQQTRQQQKILTQTTQVKQETICSNHVF